MSHVFCGDSKFPRIKFNQKIQQKVLLDLYLSILLPSNHSCLRCGSGWCGGQAHTVEMTITVRVEPRSLLDRVMLGEQSLSVRQMTNLEVNTYVGDLARLTADPHIMIQTAHTSSPIGETPSASTMSECHTSPSPCPWALGHAIPWCASSPCSPTVVLSSFEGFLRDEAFFESPQLENTWDIRL